MPVSRHPLFGNTLLGTAPGTPIQPPQYRSLYIVDSQLKVLKTMHLLAAICWVGGAFSLMILSGLREAHLELSNFTALINMCVYYVDVGVVIPGIIGCIVTGLIYSVYTNFGFIKYFWIIYKWIITLNAFFWGMTFIGPWADDIFSTAVDWGVYDLLNLVHLCVMPQNSWGGFAQFLLLLSVVAISVFRPVSFFNWYEGQHHQPAGVRHGR